MCVCPYIKNMSIFQQDGLPKNICSNWSQVGLCFSGDKCRNRHPIELGFQSPVYTETFLGRMQKIQVGQGAEGVKPSVKPIPKVRILRIKHPPEHHNNGLYLPHLSTTTTQCPASKPSFSNIPREGMPTWWG